MPKNRPDREAPAEPEYSWGDCPGGQPDVAWEHAARQVWAQSLPASGAVLLMEKERLLVREAADGAVRWEAPSPALPDEVAVDAELACLARGQELEALELATGRRAWAQKLGGRVNTLGIDPRHLYAAITQRRPGPMFALSRADGRQEWRAPLEGEPEFYPFPERDLLVVSDPEQAVVQGFATAGGARRWSLSAEGQPMVVGQANGDLLPISGHEAGAMGVDLVSGQVRWRLENTGSVEEPGVSHGMLCYFTDGTAYAVDALTGDRLWKREPEGEERIFKLRVQGDLLFAETWSGRLLALDPATGELRWERKVGQVHGLDGDAERLYLRVNTPEPEGRWLVLALDRATGKPAWELRARRMVPDLTLVGRTLVVEFRSAIVGLAV
ncbi:MAG: PQQ-binding-like beta-propeller repeat protein [Armatimonadota bacterium]